MGRRLALPPPAGESVARQTRARRECSDLDLQMTAAFALGPMTAIFVPAEALRGKTSLSFLRSTTPAAADSRSRARTAGVSIESSSASNGMPDSMASLTKLRT